MTQPYPLPRETRETDVSQGDGGASYGPFGFKIFDAADVRAFTREAGGAWLPAQIIVTKVHGWPFDDFTVTFDAPLPPETAYIVQAARLHERQVGVTKGGMLSSQELEKELSKQGSVVEELRRDVDRGGMVAPGEPGRTILIGEDGRPMPGPTGDAIADAQANAEIAQAAAAVAASAARGAYYRTLSIWDGDATLGYAGSGAELAVGAGFPVRIGRHEYDVVAAGEADYDRINARGVKLRAVVTDGGYDAEAFGFAAGATGAANKAALDAALAALAREGATDLRISRPGTYLLDPATVALANARLYVGKGVDLTLTDTETPLIVFSGANPVLCGEGRIVTPVPGGSHNGFFDGTGAGLTKAIIRHTGTGDLTVLDLTFDGVLHMAISTVNAGAIVMRVKCDGRFAVSASGETSTSVNYPGFVHVDGGAAPGSRCIVMHCDVARIVEGVQGALGVFYGVMVNDNNWREIADHCAYFVIVSGGGIMFCDNNCVDCRIAYTASFGPQLVVGNAIMPSKFFEAGQSLDPALHIHEAGISVRDPRGATLVADNVIVGVSATIEVAAVYANIVADVVIDNNTITQIGESPRTGSPNHCIRVSNGRVLDPATDYLANITITNNTCVNVQEYFEVSGADTLITALSPMGAIDVRGFNITSGPNTGTRTYARRIKIEGNTVRNGGRMLCCFVSMVDGLVHRNNTYINAHVPGSAFTNYMVEFQDVKALVGGGNIYRNVVDAPNLTLHACRVVDQVTGTGTGTSTGMVTGDACDLERFTLAGKTYFVLASAVHGSKNVCDILSPMQGVVQINSGQPSATVTNINARSDSVILLSPVNAAAASAMASPGVWANRSAGSFTATIQTGNAAANSQFAWTIA